MVALDQQKKEFKAIPSYVTCPFIENLKENGHYKNTRISGKTS